MSLLVFCFCKVIPVAILWLCCAYLVSFGFLSYIYSIIWQSTLDGIQNVNIISPTIQKLSKKNWIWKICLRSTGTVKHGLPHHLNVASLVTENVSLRGGYLGVIWPIKTTGITLICLCKREIYLWSNDILTYCGYKSLVSSLKYQTK